MQAANNYTYEEIQIGLANLPAGGDPIVWLNDNWQKLIETVQTLATKYGQEHKENVVGTISTREAREALKKHKGNVWQAVTECIEQRRLAFNAIKAQGNYLRDDIVTYLTQHQGNVDLALNELNRLQLKPFLLKIFGSPSGAENQSMASLIEPKSNVDDGSSNGTGTISRTDDDKNDILRDIEAIIGNMEEKQSKQTETILQTIESLVGNMMMASTSNQHSQPISSSASSFSVTSYDRIDVKSPVQLPKQQMQLSNDIGDSDTINVENEVRQFVTSHIQDIVPDIAALVNKELIESEVTATAQTNGDDEDNTAEYEDAIIELILENPTEHVATDVPPETIEPVNTDESSQNEISIALQETIELGSTNDSVQNATPVAETDNAKENNGTTSIAVIEGSVIVQNGNVVTNVGEGVQVANSEPAIIKRIPSVKLPKFSVNKAFQRSSLRQSDRRRIRELERQLKLQQQKRESGSQMSGYLSDSTVVPDENTANVAEESQVAQIVDTEEQSFAFSVSEQKNVETEQIDRTQSVRLSSEHIDSVANSDRFHTNETLGEESSVEMIAKDAKNRNLSEIVRDTKELIQKMKSEIDEDIAMSVSEFDGDDSYSDYSDEFSNEERNSAEFDENDLDDSDGWTDIDDDEENGEIGDLSNENYEYDNESVDAAQDNVVQSLRSSQSIESEHFVEAQAEVVASGDESQVQSDNISSHDTQEHVDKEDAQATGESIAEYSTQGAYNGVEIEITPENANVSENLETNEEALEPFPIDLVDYSKNIIEIQQSLQISLVRETPAIEKVNAEPSEDALVPDEVDTMTSAGDFVETISVENIDETIDTDIFQNSEPLQPLLKSTSENSAASTERGDEMLSEQSELSSSLARTASRNSETEEKSAAESLPENSPTVSEINTSDVEATALNDRTSRQTSTESLVETYKYNKITVPVLTQCSQSNINVMQLKKVDTKQNKIPVRRPSFSEPSVGIRNLQKELFSKQSKPMEKLVAKRPSKIVPPKWFFKEAPSPKKVDNKNQIANAEPGPSSRAIPKKKYYETCFSDDYQTSDDEKPIGSSRKVIPNLVKIIETRVEDTTIDPDALARRFIDDGLLENYLDAALAVELMQMKFDEKTAIAAAVECNSLEQAIAFLRQECELCTETYPMNKIVSMLKCTHSCCEECAKNYFTIQVSGLASLMFLFFFLLLSFFFAQITDRSIADCSCPFCKLPDLNAIDITEDDALEYFSNLDILLKNILDESTHELFQRKLRDRTLMQDPNFKWCVQCSSGFFARPRQRRLICPDCGSVTCAQCRKPVGLDHFPITST